MSRLIDTLHQYTMADAKVQFEAVDMNRTFEETKANLDLLIQKSGGQVTADDLPPVLGSAPQLIQFLQNLVANALKFCDKPVPCVHVSAPNRVESDSEDSFWLFSVADNGIGIPASKHKWIFEPFTRLSGRRDRDGTGLGLATCKKLIERHGGTIWCESAPGSGTVFHFTLPAAQPDIGRIPSPPETEAASRAAQHSAQRT